MGNITDKLSYLNDTKKAIKNAITSRGVTVSDNDTFRDYANKITEIGETVEKTKFGASVDMWIGDVDENGVLKQTTWSGALTFVGVKNFDSNGLKYAFYGCTGITSVDLSSVQTIGSSIMTYAFYGCTGIISVDLSSVQTIGVYGLHYAFNGCKKLTTISFPSLNSVQSNSFGGYAFGNCTALTEIHFRADMQTAIEACTGYSSKFGATNATIYFDL